MTANVHGGVMHMALLCSASKSCCLCCGEILFGRAAQGCFACYGLAEPLALLHGTSDSRKGGCAGGSGGWTISSSHSASPVL